MARISENNLSDQSDITDSNIISIDAQNTDKVEVPNGEFIGNADISRNMQDLVLETSDGISLIIENYFTADPAPIIEAVDVKMELWMM